MPKTAKVVGYAVDSKAEALVVEIDGTIHRKSGGVNHLTVSCKSGVRPVYSNELLEKGWTKISPYNIQVSPAVCG